MVIGDRLKELRAQKKMTQGDIEKRTGLLRCYISRVENGATVPSVSTLEKLAKALEVPLYRLFHDGKPKAMKLAKLKEWGSGGKDAQMLTDPENPAQGKEVETAAVHRPAHVSENGTRRPQTKSSPLIK